MGLTKEEFLELKNKEKNLKKAAEILRVNEEDLPRVIQRFLREIDEIKSEIISKLNEKIKNCQKCELYKNRKNAVPGEGNINAKIMFIGLGPGKSEDEEGRPFVGKAGKFLDELLEIVNLKREDVYITNVVKCIPPNNMPTEESINTCTYLYLNHQIETINPKIIVSLGEIATRYIFQRYNLKYLNMNEHHGKVYNVNNLKGKVKIICMFHPASALYNPELKEIIINDWKNLKEEFLLNE